MGRVGQAIDRALDGAGVHSPFWRRALPPLVIAVAVILISWLVWVPPSPLLLILLGHVSSTSCRGRSEWAGR
jgi:hypothetical protein